MINYIDITIKKVKKSIFLRCCNRCNEVYKSVSKYGRICQKCRISNGRPKNKVETMKEHIRGKDGKKTNYCCIYCDSKEGLSFIDDVFICDICFNEYKNNVFIKNNYGDV